MANANHHTYLGTATQLQRWRDFAAHLLAYLVVNALFLATWLCFGRGFFWPAFPLVGWAVGLSFQHFTMVVRGPITDAQVRARWQEPGGG